MIERRHYLLNRYLLVSFAVAAAVGLSLGSFFLVRQWEHNRAERAFRGISADRFHAIEEQVRDEKLKLSLLRATYLSSVEAQSGSYTGFIREFRATVRSAMLTDSGNDTIVYIKRVSNGGLASLETTMRGDGYPGFRVSDLARNGKQVPASKSTVYYPILAAEPTARNDQIQGLNLWSAPFYRATMEKALDTGRPVATSAERPITGGLAPLSFWIFTPLIEQTSAADALRGSHSTAAGFIGTEIQVQTLVENALGGLNPAGIDVLVYDNTNPAQNVLLYTHRSRTRRGEPVGAASKPLYTWSTDLNIGGRDWQIIAESAPAFVKAHTYFLSWAVLGGGLFSTAIMVGFLLWYLRRTRRVEQIVQERTNELSLEIAEHKKTEQSLTAAHASMKRRMELVNQRSREIELLSEMGDLLQTCQDLPEAYDVVARFGAQLFSSESGALFMFDGSHRFLEAVAVWGGQPRGETFFAAEECWALRRGNLHAVTAKGPGLYCQHLDGVPTERLSYLCLPLMALGETIGVLHIQRFESSDVQAVPENEDTSLTFEQSRQRLAVAIAEHAAMAFANLRLRRTLREQSIRDPLTTLYNRRYMEESVEREIHRARRNANSLGVVILDIDHFKGFNDTYGHEAGDVVLKAVAKLISDSFRKEDIPCRFGGEEFVVILPSASLESCRQKAEALRKRVEALTVEYGGERLPRITISLGVSILGPEDSRGDELLQAADAALYQAKEAGRNRVVIAEA